MEQASVTATLSTPASQLPPSAPVTSQRPESVPEKFWDKAKGSVNVDAMAQAYTALERKQSTAAPAAAPESKPPAADPAAPAAVSPAGLPAGIDFGALTTEITSNGKFSEATYGDLAKRGIPKEMVDAYVDGIRARGEVSLLDIFENKAELKKVQDWAGSELTPQELQAFNQTITSGDQTKIQETFRGLKAKYIEANGIDPQLVGGGRAASSSKTFESWQQVTAAMNDPRYKSDPAYQKDVQDRIANFRG